MIKSTLLKANMINTVAVENLLASLCPWLRHFTAVLFVGVSKQL